MRRATLMFLATIVAAGMLTGCTPTQRGATQPKPIYTGPTLPLDQVLLAINENASRVSTLNASGTFLLTIPDEAEINGQITLLYTKPERVRVFGDKDALGRVFELGTDGKQFWMVARGKTSTTWHGTNFGPAESNPSVPIAPQLLTDVLGVATLDTDLLAQPIPTLRFNPDYDCYMLTWHQPLKDRWVTLREVWYDRATLEPQRIWLFDRNGRVILRARLSQFEPLTPREASSAPARTARSYELFFPETSTRFVFNLDSVREERRGVPNRNSYRFNPAASDTDRVINLDEPSDDGR